MITTARNPDVSGDLLPTVREAAECLAPDELAAPILVGVSGGPDSLALLHLLWRWSRAGGPALRALHVDHGLRPESAAEAAYVAGLCAAWGVPVALRAVEPGAIAAQPGGLEDAARRARYRLFAEEAARQGAKALALGHQADDQAETVLLHLLRGAGLAGLAAMPAVRRSGDLLDALAPSAGATRPAIWRPLLAARRAAIEAYCRAQGLMPIYDASNDDATLRRNAVRTLILPAIERAFPGAGGTLARNAAILADDEAALRAATDVAWRECAREDAGLVWFDRAAFFAAAPALQRRLIRRAWSVVGVARAITGLSAATVEAAREGVCAGRTGARFALPDGVRLLLEPAEAVLGAADLEARLRARVPLPQVEPGWAVAVVPGAVDLGGGWRLRIGVASAGHADRGGDGALHIPVASGDDPGELSLRTWQPGDRIGAGGGTRKLQDWFVDRHIPGYLRRHLPMLARGARVLWVAGLAAFSPAASGTDAPVSADGLVLRLLYNDAPVAAAGRWLLRRPVRGVAQDTEGRIMAKAAGQPRGESIQRVLLDEATIRARVGELGAQIAGDYADIAAPIALIGILRGAVVFMADLIRGLDRALTIDFMAVSSYGASTTSSGVVRILKDINESIEGAHVIIVEDIIDSGLTLAYLLDLLGRRNPASLRVCSFLLKDRPRSHDLPPIDYIGFTIPDEFVIGYGLDYAGRYRNLPYLGVLHLEPAAG